MSPLHAVHMQAALGGIFALTGLLCAMLHDLLRLLFCAFQSAPVNTFKTDKFIISQTPEKCILPKQNSTLYPNIDTSHNISDSRALFVTFYRFAASFHNVLSHHRAKPGQKTFSQTAAGFLSGAVSALAAAAVCFIAANGQMRPYMALALMAGAALYHATVGPLLHCALQKLLRVFRALYARIGANRFVRRLFR